MPSGRSSQRKTFQPERRCPVVFADGMRCDATLAVRMSCSPEACCEPPSGSTLRQDALTLPLSCQPWHGMKACSDGRFRTEKYMQAVFAIAAVTLFVPVIYHRQRSEDVSGLDQNAPGATSCATASCRSDI